VFVLLTSCCSPANFPPEDVSLLNFSVPVETLLQANATCWEQLTNSATVGPSCAASITSGSEAAQQIVVKCIQDVIVSLKRENNTCSNEREKIFIYLLHTLFNLDCVLNRLL
jgi:hypothetical protein